MRVQVGLGLLLLALTVFVVLRRMGSSTDSAANDAVKLADIPAVLAAVSRTGRDGTFAAFLFGLRGQPPAQVDALNVQFSIEEGRVGIDWVLTAEPNLRAEARFKEFFGGKSLTAVSREGNGVKYLRVEGEHLADLLREFLQREFGVTDDQKMELIAEGFAWTG